MEVNVFECDCSDFNHIVRFTLDDDDGQIWLSFRLNHYQPLYARIWTALKYIFKRPVAYGHYDTVHLKFDDYQKIRTLLLKSELYRAAAQTRQLNNFA